MLQSLIWDLPAIISAIALIFSYIIKGHLPPDIGGLGLLGLLFFILVVGRLGSNIGRLIPLLVRVLFPFVSLLLLAMLWGGWDFGDTAIFFVSLVMICVMLFGFYLMFFGAFSKRKAKPWYDFIVIVSAVGLILGLMAQGLISYYHGIIALVLIVFFLALGRGIGGGTGWWVRILFRYGLPLVALITLFSMNIAKLSI